MANKTTNKPVSPFSQGATATPQAGLLTDEVKVGKPSGGAGLLDVGIASIMPDLESKISYYSQELGVPRERFGRPGCRCPLGSSVLHTRFLRAIPSKIEHKIVCMYACMPG